MKDYQPDQRQECLRSAITQARDVLKKHAKAYPEEFHGDLNALKSAWPPSRKNWR